MFGHCAEFARPTLQLIHEGCLCLCRRAHGSLSAKAFPAYYLHHPKKVVGWGYSLPTTPTSFTSEEGSVGGSLAVAGNETGPAPAYAAVPSSDGQRKQTDLVNIPLLCLITCSCNACLAQV